MGEETWCVEHQEYDRCSPVALRWCADHKDYDHCEELRWEGAPGPFDHVAPPAPAAEAPRAPAAPELAIYEAPTEKTLIGNPPPAPPIDTDGIPEIDAAVVEWGPEPTVPIVAYEEIATAIDAAAAPPDPVFEAQKATLAAVFEASLAEGIPPAVCNRILYAAVKKLGIGPA